MDGAGRGGGGSSEEDTSSPAYLERRRKLLKKFLTQQRSSANKLAELGGAAEFELTRPQDVIWWIKQREVSGGGGATSARVASSLTPVRPVSSDSLEGDGDWLLNSLGVFLATEGSTESADDVETRVRRIVESSSNDDVVQNDLLELLGFSDTALELIPKIIERRGYLKNKRKQQQRKPSSGAQASVPKRPLGSGIGRDAGTDRVFIKGAKIGGGFLNDSSRRALPPGTTRSWQELRKIDAPGTITARYEKVWVPAPNRPPPSTSGSDAIPTTRFGALSQKAFEGIPTLNRLQSRLFHAAYETSENLLVCAPTGAGKTNVAMTAIAREIDRLKNPKAVKVVYVAPMKALAQEVVEKFSERLASLKMQVRELTGDTQLSRGEIEKTQIVVTTPEKWDVITRKSGGDGTLGELVQLLIIDEVHLVGEDRGPVIEALVARTIRQVERRQQMVRIVGLSATLPNYIDVALFLRVNPDRGMFFFDSSFRPVPLEQTFIGVAAPTSAQQQQQQLQQAVDVFGNPIKSAAESKAEEKQVQKSQMRMQRIMENAYNEIACEYTLESIEKGNQVMVFVHTRKDTSKTARSLLEIADLKFHNAHAFGPLARGVQAQHASFASRVSKSKNQEVQYLFARGMGIHHAGMAREDRSLTEEMFTKGAISVLCCTATLAWGVNLPAHTVIVKGTQIYAPERGGVCELNSADVFQCFGRAGRPQYDTSGEAILITEHVQLQRYLAMLTHTLPLESKLVPSLPDALNAEIVSGTVSSLEEASAWLSYTFLYVRMLKSPTAYGVSLEERENDPHLEVQRMKLVGGAAKRLSEARMIRIGVINSTPRGTISLGGFVPSTPLGVTDLGRVASHYYVHHETVESLFNETLRPIMTFQELFEAICSSKEFDQLKLREEEVVEVKRLVSKACPFEPLEPLDHVGQSPKSKAFVLFQAFISRYPVDAFTLHSDMNYISQNGARIARALFEVAIARGWIHLALMTLKVCAALEKRAWWWPMQHPLRQVAPMLVALESVAQLEMYAEQHKKSDEFSLEALQMIETPESLSEKVPVLGPQRAKKMISAAKSLPRCELELVHRQPITAGLLRVVVRVVPLFSWKERILKESQSFYLFVDDGEWILHSERITLSKSRYELHQNKEDRDDSLNLTFTVPLFQQHLKYYVRLESDSGWLDVGSRLEIDLLDLELPRDDAVGTLYTDLLDLDPISILALKNKRIEDTCRFTHFNPVQTQCFHVLYHRDESCIIGAPTGSGKTTLAELAMWRVLFDDRRPNQVVVYIAPMKALVSERIADWKQKCSRWNKRIVELTGDVSPSPQELRQCDLVVATPEKFEVVTRFWEKENNTSSTDETTSAQSSSFHLLRRVALVVLDEVHLLGEERGASLESLVARIKDVSRKFPLKRIRLVGLSTALANAKDLGDWFKSTEREHVFVYNFRPAVRVVPLEVHVSGFPGAHYCPRMASMNKPVFHAIERYSKDKPVLVFVASRRQTRLTAFDLISLCASSDDPRRFLKTDLDSRHQEDLLASVEDDALRHSLQFGIALHHAGLSKSDRTLSERMFSSGACQVLIATATLAWGVNLPAHLVVIKGTEYYDASKRRYEPFPVTDVLQMMGRAGRPQFGDEKGVAVILVHDQLKSFYKRFLYEPFPVESNLISSGRLEAFANAEIANGRISTLKSLRAFLSQDTYLSVRVKKNPSFYGCSSSSVRDVEEFFARLGDSVLKTLVENKGVESSSSSSSSSAADSNILKTTKLGKVAARFDLKPQSAKMMMNTCSSKVKTDLLNGDEDDESWVVEAVARSYEFQDIPVRHKEDELNETLALSLTKGLGPFKLSESGSAHCKAYLLIQAKLENVSSLPIHDYVTDSRQVIDIASRCIPALAEVCTTVNGDARIVFAAAKVVARLNAAASNASSSRKSGPSAVLNATRESKQIKCSLSSATGRYWVMLLTRNSNSGALRVLKIERVSCSSPNSAPIVQFSLDENDANLDTFVVAAVAESDSTLPVVQSEVR